MEWIMNHLEFNPTADRNTAYLRRIVINRVKALACLSLCSREKAREKHEVLIGCINNVF